MPKLDDLSKSVVTLDQDSTLISVIEMSQSYQTAYRLTGICAQDRVAMEAIRSGICISMFQASRQAWRISG